MTNNSNTEYRLRTESKVPTIIAIDPPTQLWTEYALDGRKLADGRGPTPPGTHAATDPVSAAIGNLQAGIRAEKSETRREANTASRLFNELAHTKAIAAAVQNSLRDQVTLARDDAAGLLDKLLDARRYVADDLIDARVEQTLAEREAQAQRERNGSVHANLAAVRGELENLVVQFDDYRSGDGVGEWPTNKLLSIVHAEIDELQHQRDGARGDMRRAEIGRTEAVERVEEIETIVAKIGGLAGVPIIEPMTFPELVERTMKKVRAMQPGVTRAQLETYRQIRNLFVAQSVLPDDQVTDERLLEYVREAHAAIGQVDDLAEKNERQKAGIVAIANALQVPADSEGRYSIEVITAAARKAAAHRVSLNGVRSEIDEIAIELGIVVEEDNAETTEVLDRARTLLADHKAFERRVEQLSAANQALRGALNAAGLAAVATAAEQAAADMSPDPLVDPPAGAEIRPLPTTYNAD